MLTEKDREIALLLKELEVLRALNKELLKSDKAARRLFKRINLLWKDATFYDTVKELVGDWIRKYG